MFYTSFEIIIILQHVVYYRLLSDLLVFENIMSMNLITFFWKNKWDPNIKQNKHIK